MSRTIRDRLGYGGTVPFGRGVMREVMPECLADALMTMSGQNKASHVLGTIISYDLVKDQTSAMRYSIIAPGLSRDKVCYYRWCKYSYTGSMQCEVDITHILHCIEQALYMLLSAGDSDPRVAEHMENVLGISQGMLMAIESRMQDLIALLELLKSVNRWRHIPILEVILMLGPSNDTVVITINGSLDPIIIASDGPHGGLAHHEEDEEEDEEGANPLQREQRSDSSPQGDLLPQHPMGNTIRSNDLDPRYAGMPVTLRFIAPRGFCQKLSEQLLTDYDHFSPTTIVSTTKEALTAL
ncbi:hypothetical protein EV182_000015 [Spiromyces aspiralis]|uniref:Uncharacterized protein n=1 Tax=Spiromyces aspiralis TaxID=68401 RepID=A0ACC1I125_9FUNG|nr:hypothetical protein EV182_000015 [Spiromyces aspiralis]